MILETLLQSPSSVLSVEAPGAPDKLPQSNISRFVFPEDGTTSKKTPNWNPSSLGEIVEASEQFDVVFGGFIDSEIGHFFRDKNYPFHLDIADLPMNAAEMLKERMTKLKLLSRVSQHGYVVCQLHPDVFSCKSTRNALARLGLFVLGSCQTGTWKCESCITFLSKRKPKKIYSLLVHKDDDPRIKAFVELFAGKCSDKPEGLVVAAPDKFLAPAIADIVNKYQQEAKRLGVPLVQPSEDENAALPMKTLMAAFNDTEPSNDDFLEESQPVADVVQTHHPALEEEELLYSYLKYWFFTDIGELYASILRSKGETSIMWPIDLVPPVPIPDSATCRRVLSLQEEVSRLAAKTKRLEKAIWSTPKKVTEHEIAFKRINTPEDDPGWIAEMPFPLASIIWQIRNAPSEKERMELLLKFFEGLASFHAMILMSAAKRSQAVKIELRSILAALETKGQSLMRATFGTWSNTYGRLAKVIRGGLGGSADAACESGFLDALGIDNIKVVQALISKELVEIFQKTNDLRNRMTGHGPLILEGLAAIHVADLMPLFDRWRTNSAGVWEHLRLIQATGQASKRAGLYHVRVKLLTGNQQPFPVEMVPLFDTPDSDFVHLHYKESKNSLQLIPFIRICDPPAGTQSACYFYNRSDAQGAHYVTYSANQSPEEVFQEDPASMIMRLLA